MSPVVTELLHAQDKQDKKTNQGGLPETVMREIGMKEGTNKKNKNKKK